MPHLNLPSAVRPVPHSDDLPPPESMSFIDERDDENVEMNYSKLEDESFEGNAAALPTFYSCSI